LLSARNGSLELTSVARPATWAVPGARNSMLRLLTSTTTVSSRVWVSFFSAGTTYAPTMVQ